MNASDPSQKGTTFRKRGDEEANQNRQLPNLNKSPKKHMEDPFSPTKTKYLPSRYGTAEVFNAMNTTKRTTMLHSLESDMAGLDHQISKLKPDVIPDRLREARSHNPPLSVFKPHEFKKKPMKKADMDFQMYQEVFVSPKEQVLHKLKEKEKVIDSLFNSVSTPNYDNPLGDPRADNKPKFSFNSTSTKSLSRPERQVNFKSKALQSVQSQNVLTHESVELPKSRLQETRSENKLIREKDLIKNTTISGGMLGADSNINDLEIANALEATAEPENHDDSKKLHNERVFFDQQIQVQPPETPNFNPSSPLTPGNGWAPSIPLMKVADASRSNIKDLLVRAKAGMQAGDIQKEAHLSFYLAMVHETHKNYRQAIKYYKKFFSCAQAMEDKIGMALALNRLGVNNFNDGKFDLSEKFHLKNLDLSDRENSFAGYYNLGITSRSAGNYEDALNYFNEALEWAFEHNDVESECLSYGQIGMTYRDLKNYVEASDQFRKCYDLSLKLKNNKLQLDCLLNLSKIAKAQEQKEEDTWHIYKNAYDCAKDLNDQKLANVCLVNMGVIGGLIRYDDFKLKMNEELIDGSEITYLQQPNDLAQVKETVDE